MGMWEGPAPLQPGTVSGTPKASEQLHLMQSPEAGGNQASQGQKSEIKVSAETVPSGKSETESVPCHLPAPPGHQQSVVSLGCGHIPPVSTCDFSKGRQRLQVELTANPV